VSDGLDARAGYYPCDEELEIIEIEHEAAILAGDVPLGGDPTCPFATGGVS
jgi:hypothetical protein